MAPTRPAALAAAMLVLAAIVLASIAACTIDVASDEASPGAATGAGPERARADLATLTVAAQRSMKGYSRDHFPHWNGQGEGCDTRDVVLQRDGTGVRVGDSCKITKGQWLSPYDGKTFTNPRQLDIDHMVPLANAWRSGADSWDDEKRSAFANDLTRPQLLAVSATTNRAKGDQDPSQWRPPDKGYWCEYAQRWIAVKHHWNLAVTAAEKSKLSEMLETCG